ncbi:hypothetical protein ACN79_03560 [Escherichia coli]|nr:hypothetical protein ACN79_03560 [Escherichia coli]
MLDHVNDTQVTKPARIIGARRTELLSSHTPSYTKSVSWQHYPVSHHQAAVRLRESQIQGAAEKR